MLSAATGLSGGAVMAWYERARGRSARARLLRSVHELGFTITQAAPRVVAHRDHPLPTELRFTPPGVNGRRSPHLQICWHGVPAERGFSIKLNPAPDGERFELRGDRRRAASTLDAALRGALVPGDHLELREERLRFDTSASDLSRLEPLIIELSAAAARLREPAATRAAYLVEALVRGRDGFEAHVFEALLDEDDEAAASARELATAHPSSAVRLLAARSAGDVDAVDALALAPETDEATAEAAIATASASARRQILEDARVPEGRRVALTDELRPEELDRPDWQRRLAAVASSAAQPVRLRAAAVRALARSGAHDAEATLLNILDRPDAGTSRWSRDEVMLREAVVRALAGVGSERSLVALHRLSDRAGLYAPLWPAAQAALTQLEARLGPLSAGRLSLPPPDEGGLSIPDDPHS